MASSINFKAIMGNLNNNMRKLYILPIYNMEKSRSVICFPLSNLLLAFKSQVKEFSKK